LINFLQIYKCSKKLYSILEKENNFKKFTELNKLYYAVSGSLIKPEKTHIIFT